MALPGGPSLDLSDLELEFVRIPLKQFAACRRFIDSNPSILNTNTDDLSTAAIAAATNGSDSLSQQCVQRLVILNDCRGRSSRDRAAYFNELASAGSHGSRDFQNQCQRVEQRVAARVQGSRPPPQAVSAPSSNSQPLGIAGANTYAVTLPIRTGQSAYQASIDQRSEAAGNYRSTPSSHPIRQGEYSTTRQGDPAGFPTRLPLVTSLSHPDDEDTNQIQSEEPGRPQPGYPGTQDPRPPGRQRRHSQRSSQGDLGQRRNLYTQTLPTAHGGDAAEFRGESQPGPLDKSYKVRGDARTFFTPGTMFVMIWYENWGGQHKRAGAASDKNTSSRFRGEKVYTTPRRMVVIRQRRGYCVCVPIYSYGGQGVKSNMPESEKQAHAIIHAQGRPAPEPLSTEPEFKKRPIAADMNAGETLTATSRIHFAKYHTVEHNVKVKEIGRIAGESMADFVSYWRQELLGP